MTNEKRTIQAAMTVLDVVHKHRRTEDVFHRYDEQAGECIMCSALFERLDAVADKYGLDLDGLLQDLERAASA